MFSVGLNGATVPQQVLWREPTGRDLAYGPGGTGGRPIPPFRFLEADQSGTRPKIKVRDARGREWSVKFGPEARASVFSSHFAWASGYFADTEYFVARGRVTGARGAKLADGNVGADGRFRNARFQLRAKSPKFVRGHNWAWVNNPFNGSKELNGLRILMMLLSNWDAKDARDLNPDSHSKFADSNLGIFETASHEYRYFVSDWGGTMGKWSGIPGFRDPWNAKAFADQSADLVKGVEDGQVEWGFAGTHGGDLRDNIRPADVRWFLRYAGRFTDSQIRRGLVLSGANRGEADAFTRAIRSRIDQLRRIAYPKLSARR